jgi:putative sugar O-methyltransferase
MIIEAIKERAIRSRQTSRNERLAAHELDRISQMFIALEAGHPAARPSRYWNELNKMNVAQLKENGYENFKRTIALNYFTWTRLLPWDSKILFLCRQLPVRSIMRCFFSAFRNTRQSYFGALSLVQSVSYNFLSLLQWAYLFRLRLPAGVLDLCEPQEGNPPLIEPMRGRTVSQDLANAILEYDSFERAVSSRATILELGAGYGRDGYVIMKMHSDVRYIVVDIPPALWVAERYLASVFPERRVFRYRDFDQFEDVAEEFDKAQIAFLLSSQLLKLPAKSTDLVLNISSLHEMRPDQISFYFEQFDRVLKPGGHMYTKQWRVAKVLFEGLTLAEADYPIPSSWSTVFTRTARVQTKFFEALYRKVN